jgi:hypothetical protein
MNFDPRKKTVELFIEQIRMPYWFPVVVCLMVAWLVWQIWIAPSQIVFEVSAEKGGVFQVFVDSGDGFSEEQSFLFELYENEWTRISIPLQGFPSVRMLRIDPINHDGRVLLRTFRKYHRNSWTSRDLLEPEYPLSHGILRWQPNAKKHQLEIYPESGQGDPQFIVEEAALAQPGSELSSVSRGILVASIAVVVGAVLGFLFSGVWVRVLAQIWVGLLFPFRFYFRTVERYTRWIDRMSIKWEMVNPTSCAVAGLVVALVLAFAVSGWDLVTEKKHRLSGSMIFDVVGGRLESVQVYAITDARYREEQSVFRTFVEGRSEGSIELPLPDVDAPITHFRIDPMEGEGSLDLAGLRVVRADGREFLLPITGWTANDHLQIEEVDGLMRLKGIGPDPFMVSPELGIDMGIRSTLPARVFVPFWGFFITFLALLLYNRLLTEGMTPQQIRTLAKSG